jgi:unsaturated rhamnogalacturonyl hydrolase
MITEKLAASREQYNALEWAVDACQSLMNKFDAAELPPSGHWHYHQGIFLFGMLRLWEQNDRETYLPYMKRYVDSLIDAQGNFLYEKSELDSIQAGFILFELDRQYKDNRYKIAADKLLHLLDTFNRTSEGGYWHKDKYPYQMWLDGLYMAGVFTMMYGQYYNKPQLYDRVLEQERLMRKNTKDEITGLYYHAWDESKQTPWSDKQTGRSPEFWGRAMGWYGMCLVDFLEVLPQDHPGRNNLQKALNEFAAALVKFQDKESGLWYQVVDKGDRPDNWIETSCSCLFIYTLAKGVRLGYLDDTFAQPAVRGYQGLLTKVYYNEQEEFVLPDICIGTGVGDYDHYINRPCSENDLHGVGAFVLVSVEMRDLYHP